MKLYDQGQLKLTDPASKYLPALRNTNKKNITIRELLLHESGLVPYIRFYRNAIDEYSVTGPFTQGFVDEWHHTRMGNILMPVRISSSGEGSSLQQKRRNIR